MPTKLNNQDLDTAIKALPKMQGMLLEKAVLMTAFSLVENKKDSRGAIDATVNSDMCEFEPEVIVRAVQFFTATTPAITKNGNDLVVRSIGYRAGPAGDH